LKILLDECVPRKLAGELTGHDVSTVPKMGWAGIRNGVLLSLIEKETFEAFLTVDRNLTFQQQMNDLKFKVIVLHSKTNRLDDLKKLVPSILKALSDPPKEQITHIAQ